MVLGRIPFDNIISQLAAGMQSLIWGGHVIDLTKPWLQPYFRHPFCECCGKPVAEFEVELRNSGATLLSMSGDTRIEFHQRRWGESQMLCGDCARPVIKIAEDDSISMSDIEKVREDCSLRFSRNGNIYMQCHALWKVFKRDNFRCKCCGVKANHVRAFVSGKKVSMKFIADDGRVYFFSFFMPMLWPLFLLALLGAYCYDRMYPYLPTIKWPSFENMKERMRKNRNKKIEAKLKKQVLAMQTEHIPDGALTQVRMTGLTDSSISISESA